MDYKIAIIVAIIEIISVLVKHFWPNFATYLPLINTAIGIIASLLLKTDVLVGLVTAGISIAGYDFIHGMLKKDKDE